MISIQSADTNFTPDFISQISAFTTEISKLEGIDYIISPTNTLRYVKVPLLGFHSSPLLRQDSPQNLDIDLKKINKDNSLYQYLFSHDKSALLCYIVFSRSVSSANKITLTEVIQQKSVDILTKEVGLFFAGQPNTQAYYMGTLRQELILFSSISLALLILFITITYRSLLITIYSILTLLVSLTITFGLVSLVLDELDFLMTILPTIIFVIGNSTLIHLIEDHQQKEQTNYKVFNQNRTKRITFISSITTAIGFFSLYFLPIEPIQTFGIFAALGIIISWITAIVFFNALMNLHEIRIKSKQEKSWTVFLSTLFDSIIRRRKVYVFGILVFVGVALIGINKLNPNSYFLGDLNKESTLKQELSHFEENYGGIRPFELGLTAKRGTLLTPNTLNDLNEIQTYIDSIYQVSMPLSLVVFFKEINQALHGGNPLENKIPLDSISKQDLINAFSHHKVASKLNFIIDSTLTKTRITGKIPDLGAQAINAKNKALISHLKQYDDRFDYSITGAAHLMDNSNNHVTFNLLIGIAFSLILVTIVIGISLQSVKIALISILPNLYPLILVAGIMGYIGIDLNIGTAIIFTVLYGIAVDDTIHFLIRFSAEIGKEDALRNTFIYAGKKIIITSFIISSGFMAFILSDFGSTFYAGIFISTGLVIALLTDLILLPILLHYFIKTKKIKK